MRILVSAPKASTYDLYTSRSRERRRISDCFSVLRTCSPMRENLPTKAFTFAPNGKIRLAAFDAKVRGKGKEEGGNGRGRRCREEPPNRARTLESLRYKEEPPQAAGRQVTRSRAADSHFSPTPLYTSVLY